MDPVNKKKRGFETLSCPPEAVKGSAELGRTLQEHGAALEESQEKVARLGAEVSQLKGGVASLVALP
jgi:predicted nuclease with TOPRIM domain